MTIDDGAPTDAELREAELLADAMEHPARSGRDVGLVEDALSAAWLLRSSRRPEPSEVSELRARAIFDAAVPKRRAIRARAAIALAAAAAAMSILELRPRRAAQLPEPDGRLLQVQLAAARMESGVPLSRLESERAAYRERLYMALKHTYGGSR